MKTATHPLATAILGCCLALGAGFAQAIPAAADTEIADADAKALYREGQDALVAKDWERALQHFRELERDLRRDKAAGVDSAMYWQAYALGQGRRNEEAARVVEKLGKEFPKSRWLDDARAISAATDASPDRADRADRADRPDRADRADSPGRDDRDEEALMAIDALLVTSSPKAVPILQRVLAGQHGDKVKSRALFVLTQLDASAADGALNAILQGNGSNRLKQEAIRTIAAGGQPASLDKLLPLFRDSKDSEIRGAVIEAWLIGGRGDLVRQAAENEPDPKVRRRAIQTLGAMGDVEAIEALIPRLTDERNQREAVQALGVAGATDALAKIARGNGPVALREEAVRSLGISGGKKAGDAILGFYSAQQPEPIRRAAIQALMMTGDGKRLIELYRRETDSGMKRELLHAITATSGDDAIDLIDEMLK